MENGFVRIIIVIKRLTDILVKAVIMTIISAGEIGEAIEKINNFS